MTPSSTPICEYRNVQLTDSIDRVKAGEIVQLLEADGWFLARTRGSHRQFKHPRKPGRVTVAGKLSCDLHPKTRASILRQAGLKRR